MKSVLGIVVASGLLTSCLLPVDEKEIDISSSSVQESSSNSEQLEEYVSCGVHDGEGGQSSCYETSLETFSSWDKGYSFCDDHNFFQLHGCNQDYKKKCENIIENGVTTNVYIYSDLAVNQIEAMGGCEGLQKLNESHSEDDEDFSSETVFSSSSEAIDKSSSEFIIKNVNENLISCLIVDEDDNEPGACLQVSSETYENWPLDDEPFCDVDLGHTYVKSCDQTTGITCKGIVTPEGIVANVSYYSNGMIGFIEEMGGCAGLQEMIDEGESESSEATEDMGRLKRLLK